MRHKIILACFFFLTPLISVLACDPVPEWVPPPVDKWNNLMNALLASEKEEGPLCGLVEPPAPGRRGAHKAEAGGRRSAADRAGN